MSDREIIDARGLSCPQPAMLVRNAIMKNGVEIIEVLLDSGTARDNITRLAGNTGWNTETEVCADGSYRLILKK